MAEAAQSCMYVHPMAPGYGFANLFGYRSALQILITAVQWLH